MAAGRREIATRTRKGNKSARRSTARGAPPAGRRLASGTVRIALLVPSRFHPQAEAAARLGIAFRTQCVLVVVDLRACGGLPAGTLAGRSGRLRGRPGAGARAGLRRRTRVAGAGCIGRCHKDGRAGQADTKRRQGREYGFHSCTVTLSQGSGASPPGRASVGGRLERQAAASCRSRHCVSYRACRVKTACSHACKRGRRVAAPRFTAARPAAACRRRPRAPPCRPSCRAPAPVPAPRRYGWP